MTLLKWLLIICFWPITVPILLYKKYVGNHPQIQKQPASVSNTSVSTDAGVISKSNRHGSAVFKLSLPDISAERAKMIESSRYESLDFGKELWKKYYKSATEKAFTPKTLQTSGIYCMVDTLTNTPYVGQAQNVKKRWIDHIRAGCGAEFGSSDLYRYMYKVGPEHFTYQVLEYCPSRELDERERYWIKEKKAYEHGFNSTKGNKS